MRRGHSALWHFVVVGILRPLLFLLFKRDWRGREHIPREGGVIIAPNHMSWADPLVMSHFVYESRRWPVFLAKAAIFKIPVIGYIVRSVGQIPVYRDRAEAALALRDAEKGLKDGASVIVYPEGTCTRDPDLWPMTAKTGVARLALTTGAPVIPVAHWGCQHVLPYPTKRFRPFPRKTIKVLAGPPVDLSAYDGKPLTAEVLRNATADVMAAITELLGEVRGETPPKEPYDMNKARAEKFAKRPGNGSAEPAATKDGAEEWGGAGA
ncbi:MAG: 1-acyl-sn-glycerol-3-phosphate acyltransferase [Streptosporangiales bacterium]|nr:1-acyl-sn-glycerol-3-phosphate acyltransferase [Streptosporangiales bacterium]